MSDDAWWARALEGAQALDAADPLAGIREKFLLPAGMTYLDGNSLGPAPKAAFAEIEVAAREEWAQDLITSWNKADWFALPNTYGDMLAPLIGAGAGEVVVCDTTSLNVYKTVHAGLNLRPGRSVVLAEGGSFPTDLYMTEGVLSSRPDVRLRLEGVHGSDLLEMIDEDVAVLLVSHVDYRTGRIRDVEALTAKAHAKGAVVIWDLCHSAGVLEVGLNPGRADMAVGCTYKYLNGGPGSPAYVFAARRHLNDIRQPLSGWWGHARPFDFEQSFAPDPGIRKFLCGTQGILSFRGLKAGLDVYDGLDMKLVRAKSMALTGLFIEQVDASCEVFGVGVLSPRDSSSRGSQVALTHVQGHAIVQALIARGVVGDYREPQVMRFGFSPLYIGYAEVVRAARSLQQVLACEVWRDARYQSRGSVT
jgi:kynureninase